MEILFIFSTDGIVHGMTAAGHLKWSHVRFGFTQLPWEEKKAELISAFKDGLSKCSGKFKILFVTNDGRKKYLKKAIQKHIRYLKENYSNDNHLFWESDLLAVDAFYFDKYNKDIVAEM